MPQKKAPTPSSGSEGYFLPPPRLLNQFEEDITLRRISSLYLPQYHHTTISPDLNTFGDAVISPQIFSWIASAESNPPTLSTHGTFGHPRSQLITSEGWRALSALGIKHGIVAIPYEAQYGAASRLVQFLFYHLWSGSCAITTCPSAMADGAARLLSLHVTGTTGGDRDTQKAAVLRAALARLTSRDPAHAWTSGQWMTERSGGSDVRGTETVARRLDRDSDGALDAHGLPLGPWSVDGFKWFSSATDCNMTILLAQTPGGLSTFYAPMRRQASSSAAIASPDGSELNGVTIQRLKPKLGTRALPTAELELKNLRAYLLGVEGQGVREISAILNITRIHTALSALGMWGRGLAISRAFSRVRRVAGGTLLTNVPAHVRTIARETVDYAAMMHLGYVTVTALGCVEQNGHIWPFNSTQEAGILLRLLTPVAKAMCSKRAISGLQECMESLGGIGYLEDEQMFNVARLFRDVNVLSIWEGTTEVMAEDVIRVITGRQGQEVRKALDVWVRRHVSSWGSSWAVGEECVKAELAVLEECWTNMSAQELVYNGRKGLDRLAFVVAAVMMVEDARRDASVTATAIARRWIYSREADISGKEKPWKEDAEMDRLIAFQLEADSNHGPAKL